MLLVGPQITRDMVLPPLHDTWLVEEKTSVGTERLRKSPVQFWVEGSNSRLLKVQIEPQTAIVEGCFRE